MLTPVRMLTLVRMLPSECLRLSEWFRQIGDVCQHNDLFIVLSKFLPSHHFHSKRGIYVTLEQSWPNLQSRSQFVMWVDGGSAWTRFLSETSYWNIFYYRFSFNTLTHIWWTASSVKINIRFSKTLAKTCKECLGSLPNRLFFFPKGFLMFLGTFPLHSNIIPPSKKKKSPSAK